MKINKSTSIQLAAVTIAVGLATSTVQAATIDWGSGAQNITGDSDVSTTGTLVDAFALGDSDISAPTVNGVTFVPFVFPDPSYSNPNTATSGNYNFTENEVNGLLAAYSGLGTGSGAFTGLSASYQNLLAYGGGSTTSDTLALTMGGLTIGQTYEFEWWNNNSSFSESFNEYYNLNTTGSAGNAVSLDSNDGSNAGTLGQFAIGTFTADATSQEIDFNGITAGADDPMLNAFQLRDTTPTPAPEPSTLALAAMGGLSLLRFRRRQHSAR